MQAALLSVLQQLVASLAAIAPVTTNAAGAGASMVQAVATPVFLAGARAAVGQLPSATACVLLAALEHMCEAQGVEFE